MSALSEAMGVTMEELQVESRIQIISKPELIKNQLRTLNSLGLLVIFLPIISLVI